MSAKRLRSLLLLAMAALSIAPRLASALELDLGQLLGERVLGRAEAPITIIEYASLTCPHCKRFELETLPQLKSAYIEPGKAKLVFRDFPLDGTALKAAALARCAPAERYFPLLDLLYSQQDAWMAAKDPTDALRKLGRLAGIKPDAIEACLASDRLLDGIVASRLKGERDFKVDGTPAFIIGGAKVQGFLSFEELDRRVRALP
jgi:protein-disulfide isomerase